MAEPGAAMAAEIAQGPAAIGAAAAAVPAGLRRPAGIVIFARGSSENAAFYGRYLLEALAGIPVALGIPSLATAYRAETKLDGWLAIGVSQSGRTEEIVSCLRWARERGAETLAITNDPGSRLAAEADAEVDLASGEELAVAATKTFLAECAALASLAYGWSPQRADWDAVVDAARRVLESPQDEDLVEALAGADDLVVLGRGFRYPIAREVSLKLMEACRVWAVAMSWADLLHGPITAVPPGSSCLLLPDRESLADSYRAIRARLEAAGAELLAAPAARVDGIPEPLLGLLDAVALQRPILEAARRRGLDPDRPQGLTKVTQT